MPDSYKHDELLHLSDLRHARERPEMYFGDLDDPRIPNCMAREAFCLAIDQIVSKSCSQMTTEFTSDGFASVSHNGTPLSVVNDARFPNMSEMQAVAEIMGFCADHASSSYVQSSVCKNGMTALNALCERFELHNYHDGVHYLLTYNRGERESSLQSLGPTDACGVTVRFKPDGSMVRHTRFDAQQLHQWFMSIPIDSSGVEIEWNDQRDSNAR